MDDTIAATVPGTCVLTAAHKEVYEREGFQGVSALSAGFDFRLPLKDETRGHRRKESVR